MCCGTSAYHECGADFHAVGMLAEALNATNFNAVGLLHIMIMGLIVELVGMLAEALNGAYLG